MTKFLHGEELNDAVYDIIYNAKKFLLLVSPYIKLDDYFKKGLLDKHKGNAELEIIIAFGKNRSNVSSSLRLNDFEYFQEFPNISIVYIPNLHAKYYANESSGIVTSINLYDYSFKNNIEFGVLFTSNFIGASKIDSEAFRSAMEIIKNNYAVFVRIPTFKKRLLGKDYLGSVTKHDVIQQLVEKGSVAKKSYADFDRKDIITVQDKQEDRISREAFEKGEKEVSKPDTSYQESTEGFCIRCGTIIKKNLKAPFCKPCYYKWVEEGKGNTNEVYCHYCNNLTPISKKDPLCKECNLEYMPF